MNTIESVCNAALDQIGYKRHIGSIWEGSVASRVALDVWAQTRDELLETIDPDFSRKDAALVVIRQAPADWYETTPWNTTFPPMPWRFSYAYPSDCLKPLQIKVKATFFPLFRPRAILFRDAVDALTGVNCILTSAPEAVLSYTAQITDPTVWHDQFTTAVIQALAQKFAPLNGMPMKERENADAA